MEHHLFLQRCYVCLTDDSLEHAAGAAEIVQVTGFGTPRYLVQPADGRRFETGFRWGILWVDHLDFHFHSVLTTLNPTLPGFTSLFHRLLNKIKGDQHRSTAFRQPSPDGLDFGTIDQLPNGDLPLLGAFVGVPGHEETVLADSRPDIVKQFAQPAILPDPSKVYNQRARKVSKGAEHERCHPSK